ncbi:MAG: hypothetical protein JJLCMIEE_01748 [Acidimicrobiales bacterium]|nr:hypothetical protein [Acidimicrobiales bacterium]
MLAVALFTAACSSTDGGADDQDSGDTNSNPSVEETGGETAGEVRGEAVAVPTITGPVTGGEYDMPFNPMPTRLAEEYDYVEEEYFIEGTASAYAGEGTWGGDGDWTAAPSTTAPYVTRFVVRKPSNPEDFNGTVLVEWLNVSAGMDADPDFGFAHDMLLDNGYAYVGVSAQEVGVEGGGFQIPIPGFETVSLKEWDPERYATLDHPGDDYAYDIYSQTAQALRRPEGADPLEGFDVETVIAAGESQSAIMMVTYVNAIHPLADIYDGFFIHSRSGTGGTLGEGAVPVNADAAFIRTDLEDPVFQFQTETDLFTLRSYLARQPDTDMIRTWEVAGTAHADQATIDYGFESGRMWNDTADIDFDSLCGQLNQGPQTEVVSKAIDDLRTWIVDGEAPAEAPPLEVIDDREIARDENGNALGGVRSPAVDAPIATLTGDNTSDGGAICMLFGSTIPFDEEKLASLYPTHEDYVDAVTEAAETALAAGYLLEDAAQALIEEAEAAPIPS